MMTGTKGKRSERASKEGLSFKNQDEARLTFTITGDIPLLKALEVLIIIIEIIIIAHSLTII